ncbi:Protein phosphatase 1K mitochondrial [Fasciola hepatica]|uniref:Protein phosphatase 1K mitochondrial n=1 Tax=Fasciola hepatica TaxID=6192 RepID=A0A4E0RGR6_FASHE|nr:Protein phosphatase 1K mitochondrial [Fasciola hepatica]
MALCTSTKFQSFSKWVACSVFSIGQRFDHCSGRREVGQALGNILQQSNALQLPLDNEESIEQGTLIPRIDLCHIGSASVLGRRQMNEDRLLACRLSSHHLLLGMFDGHGGCAAADFSRALFPGCVRSCLSALRNSTRQSFRDLPPDSFERVLGYAFLQVNNLMSRHFFHYAPVRERTWSGTTATVVLLLHSQQLIVGHVGDSRALIYRRGRVQPLTVNHDPSSVVPLTDILKEDDGGGVTEPERIVACGGMVIPNSLGVPVVNGRLGMTRSLGDAELKAYGVSAKPHLTSLTVRHSRASFLALVSDGVTHVMSDEEIASSIAACRTPQDAAKFLVECALQYGSNDNASALIVPFGSWGKS